MAPVRTLLRKARVGWSLVRGNRYREVLGIAAGKVARVVEHRIDRLDLRTARLPDPGADAARFRCHLAAPAEMEALFAGWRDSREEYERHRRVFFDMGFRRCFLLSDPTTGQVGHFQFLLTYEDRDRIERLLPRPVFQPYLSPDSAWQEWIYTFTDSRNRGLSIAAAAHVVRYCLEHGITTLYSRRGARNYASIGMADRIGYVPIARAYQVQFLGQEGSGGLYWVRPVPTR